MSNISWGKNANYETLSDAYVKNKKQTKTTVIDNKKDSNEELMVNINLLEKLIENFTEVYKNNPDKKIYDGLVTLESILNSFN